MLHTLAMEERQLYVYCKVWRHIASELKRRYSLEQVHTYVCTRVRTYVSMYIHTCLAWQLAKTLCLSVTLSRLSTIRCDRFRYTLDQFTFQFADLTDPQAEVQNASASDSGDDTDDEIKWIQLTNSNRSLVKKSQRRRWWLWWIHRCGQRSGRDRHQTDTSTTVWGETKHKSIGSPFLLLEIIFSSMGSLMLPRGSNWPATSLLLMGKPPSLQ